MGLSSAGYNIYVLLLTLASIGVPNAISKLVAERTTLGDHKGAFRIFKIALFTFGAIGLAGSLFIFVGAHTIATNWLSMPLAEKSLVALSPAVFFVAISAVFRGYFNGRQYIKVTANSQTLEQIFNTVLTIVFVAILGLFPLGTLENMAASSNIATTLSIFLSFSYLYLIYRSQLKDVSKEIVRSVNYKYESAKKVVKRILTVSIPMSLSAIMSSFNKNIDSFTVVKLLKPLIGEANANIQYGIISGKVDKLTSLPLSINIAFATVLVPNISASIAKGDKESITKRVSFSLLVSILIGLPCTIGMIIFAEPILNLLFPNATQGTLILQISALTIIFTILDQTINGTLQGIGKVMVPAIALGCGMIAKLVCNLVLLPIPGIEGNGAAIGSVVCHMIAFIISFSILRKNITLNLNFKKFVVKPFLATAIMGICSYAIYLILSGINLGNLATIISLIVAVIVYIIAIIVLGVLSKEELFMIPYGSKMYDVLKKIGVYK